MWKHFGNKKALYKFEGSNVAVRGIIIIGVFIKIIFSEYMNY